MSDPLARLLRERRARPAPGNAMVSGEGGSSEQWFPNADVRFVAAEAHWAKLGVKLDDHARAWILLRLREACRWLACAQAPAAAAEARRKLSKLSKLSRQLADEVEEYEAMEGDGLDGLGWALENKGLSIACLFQHLSAVGALAPGDEGDEKPSHESVGRPKGTFAKPKRALMYILNRLWLACTNAGGRLPMGSWNKKRKDRVTPFAEGAHALIGALPSELFGKPEVATIAEYIWEMTREERPPAGKKL